MAKVDFKKAKNITKVGAPIERTVKWNVIATEHNLDDLKALTGNLDLKIDDSVELDGQVFIKRLNFKAGRDAAKAFDWELDYDNIENSKIKSVDSDQLQASQLVGSVCLDVKGTPFFASIHDVYDSDPNFIAALYKLSDDLNNFMGKSRTKNSTDTNSSVNSQSMELVETASRTSSKT
ncbi:phage tail assembly chaperone family protein, TAC [Acinetobacter ursingii]|uniref:phage tail assembly chaperone family protein, TAC n=1 Tax=Acinetobacter ursingii TaxID=108980 RepID=UPI00124CAEE3|nr:phage tail assembly chaperone family protein, TAC [Acinetobacter ursingii]